MEIKLREGEVEEGKREFYLVGLDEYDDFEVVTGVLITQFNCNLIHSLDGIWYREGTFVNEEIVFKILFHDEVGIYAFATGDQKPGNPDKLREVLYRVVKHIQAKV